MTDDHTPDEPPIELLERHRDPDDLDGVETSMSRFAGRIKGWLAALVSVALVLPLGGWLINELDFWQAGTAVEDALGDDEGLADSVFLVRAVGCDGMARSGSAFVVEVDGERALVTNRHVVEATRTVGLRALAGGSAVAVDEIRLAPGADVAVLTVDDGTELPPALPLGVPAAVGDDVRVVGFPAARPYTTAGAVSEVGRALVLDLRVDPGASGSPVVGVDDQVVGQVFARTDDGRGIATPADVLARAAAEATPAAGC